MATEFHWLESHIGSFESIPELAGKLFWHLSAFQGSNGRWYVKTGESVIFSSDSEEAFDAFLYGMGLAYAGIPEDLLESLADDLRNRGFAG